MGHPSFPAVHIDQRLSQRHVDTTRPQKQATRGAGKLGRSARGSLQGPRPSHIAACAPRQRRSHLHAALMPLLLQRAVRLAVNACHTALDSWKVRGACNRSRCVF